MAQDFGDEAGESLRRMLARAASYYIRDWMREREYQRRLSEREGVGADAPGADVEQTQPEEVCLPFGEAGEAERFADLCHKGGIDVTALTDADGRGFVKFAPDDLERLQGLAPQFAELMTRLQIERINKTLEAEPVTPEKAKELTEIKGRPHRAQEETSRRPADSIDTHGRDAKALGTTNHTERIAQEVEAARAQCHTLDDLQKSLADKGIGTTVSKEGEVMFYEPRLASDGTFLPYSHEQRDWAIGARTLKERYGVDATHDSFIRGDSKARERQARSEPQVADGSLDVDGRTPDINQGIESHDGMDTDVSTLRLEREQNGTDIAPSEVRKETDRAHDDDRSLDSVAKECRAASKQLEHESGIADRELDISDKLNPVR